MAASSTETELTFVLVSVIPGTASGAQGIGIIGAIGMNISEEAQGAITTIIRDAEKQWAGRPRYSTGARCSRQAAS